MYDGDVTLGNFTSDTIDNAYVDQESADYIDERPTCPFLNGQFRGYNQLNNYGTTSWYGSNEDSSGNSHNLNVGSYEFIDMYAYANQSGYNYLMSEQGGYVNGQFVRHTLSDATDFVNKWVAIAPGPLGEYYNC